MRTELHNHKFHQLMASIDLMEQSGMDEIEVDEYTKLNQLAGKEFRKMMRKKPKRRRQ